MRRLLVRVAVLLVGTGFAACCHVPCEPCCPDCPPFVPPKSPAKTPPLTPAIAPPRGGGEAGVEAIPSVSESAFGTAPAQQPPPAAPDEDAVGPLGPAPAPPPGPPEPEMR